MVTAWTVPKLGKVYSIGHSERILVTFCPAELGFFFQPLPAWLIIKGEVVVSVTVTRYGMRGLEVVSFCIGFISMIRLFRLSCKTKS